MVTKQWSKRAAVQRMHTNNKLQEALVLEPRLQPIITEAQVQRNAPGYNRLHTYDRLKAACNRLVGASAENPALRGWGGYHTVVIKTIDDLLPPDDVDLYPDGKPE